MVNEQLYINGHEVDIYPEGINLNLQINDMGSAQDRQSSYSNTIRLPKTSKNQMVLGFLGTPGSMSRVPYTQLPCRYVVNGVPIVISGMVEVRATAGDYEVVIYDGVIDLTERLKDVTLSDLNYSDLNHYLSSANYTDSFGNTSGYIYGIADFGLGRYKIERQVPSIYTHTLWQKAFQKAGVNYFGSFFNTNEDFKTEVVTPPQGYEVQDIAQTITLMGNYQTDTVSHFESSNDYIFEADEYFNHAVTFSHPDLTWGINGQIIVNKTMNLQMDINVDYNSNEGYNQFHVKLNGGTTDAVHLDPTKTVLTIDLNMSVVEGDIITFMISGSDTGYDDGTSDEGTTLDGGATIESQYYVDYTAQADVTFSEATGGFLVDFNTIMGNTPVLALIKDVMQRYGLVLKPIRGTKDYEFIQFEELLNDRTGADDWSDKVVDISGEEYGVKYAKVNTASYSYHEDIQVPTHDGALTIDNTNTEPEKTLFKSPYQIPITVGRYKNEPLYSHPVWEQKEEDGQTVIKVKENKIKTFRIKMVDGSHSVTYFNDTNGVTHPGPVPMLSLDNMEMQYFLNVYYKAFGLCINTYKEVDALMNLSMLDIYGLDFFKMKYIKQMGKFYYLNKVQFKAGGVVSKVKLIEINEFSTNSPVEELGTYTYTMSHGVTRTVSMSYLTTSATPEYSDPENDAPFKVKWLTGSGTDIKLRQAGVEITAGQEILVSDWDVTVESMGTNTNAHEYTWEYQIADEGSKTYGTEVGTFINKVNALVNYAPVADAGADESVYINTTDGFGGFAQLDGSGSYDNTGSITYSWSIVSAPFGHTCLITNPTQEITSMDIPAEQSNIGEYVIRLTVTDQYGASDTDDKIVNVYEDFGGGTLEPA